LITLTFRPVCGELAVLIRGAYFRICADGTLRAPDNTITANYADGIWSLGQRQHRTLECREAVYLRVTHGSGSRESIGPYESLTVSGGAIFCAHNYLGAHAAHNEPACVASRIWREVAILSHGGK
jgi:hypothetical protein